MEDLEDDTEFGMGADRRDWASPRDPARVAALLVAFRGMVSAVPPTVPVVCSECPAWFDDAGHGIRETVRVGGRTACVSGYWWDPCVREGPEPPAGRDLGEILAWLANQPAPESTPSAREGRRRATVERVLGEFGEGPVPGSAAAVRALLDAVHAGGSLGREAVEAALHPLETEEILSFARLPTPDGPVDLLFVSHSNGYTDVAYGLDPEGSLLFWAELGGHNELKDEMVPAVPDPSLGVRIGLNPAGDVPPAAR